MMFVKGISGNPGGRPKALVEVQDAAREHTATAVATLARICADQTAPPSAQVAAATALLDRGWGRPTQAVEARARGLTLEELIVGAMRPEIEVERG